MEVKRDNDKVVIELSIEEATEFNSLLHDAIENTHTYIGGDIVEEVSNALDKEVSNALDKVI